MTRFLARARSTLSRVLAFLVGEASDAARIRLSEQASTSDMPAAAATVVAATARVASAGEAVDSAEFDEAAGAAPTLARRLRDVLHQVPPGPCTQHLGDSGSPPSGTSRIPLAATVLTAGEQVSALASAANGEGASMQGYGWPARLYLARLRAVSTRARTLAIACSSESGTQTCEYEGSEAGTAPVTHAH